MRSCTTSSELLDVVAYSMQCALHAGGIESQRFDGRGLSLGTTRAASKSDRLFQGCMASALQHANAGRQSTTLLTLGSFSPSSLQLHRLSLAASLQHKPVLHGIDLHAAYAYLLDSGQSYAAVKSLLLLLPIGLDRFEPGDPGTASSTRGH
jgi:hypothetical protein